MTETSDHTSDIVVLEDKNELVQSSANMRYSFCKDWLEKQNSEGARKFSQQSKNDIQFIMQTQAGRKKFMLSAAENDATLPEGVGESSVEPKAVPLQRLRKDDVRMECEWPSCNEIFEDYQEFQNHCRNHISDLKVSEENGTIFYYCLWDICKHKTSDYDEMCRHVNYHAYHARLLAIGLNGRATLNLMRCKKDSSKRNQLPILKSDFCCMWTGCDFKFKSIQIFLDHVKVHVHYATPKHQCSWAGCGCVFSRRTILETHVRSHTGERIIACSHCGAHFSCNRKLTDHLKRQNVLPNEYTCSVCGFSYATEYLLRQHARQHVSQYACTLCDMSAPTLATLAQHVRYRHIGEECRIHKCPHCKHKAITKSDLRKHIQTHTRKKQKRKEEAEDSDFSAEGSDVDVNRKRKKKGRKYVCHMCPEKEPKVFSRGSSLTTHLVKVHGAQWPFGHSRFRYQISEDGMYRLTTTRYEILEVSKKIVDGYSGPKDSLSNSFEFNLEEKAKATATTPTRFEITLKNGDNEFKSESKTDENTVEITMCDVDEDGNIICSEVIKSDVYYTRR